MGVCAAGKKLHEHENETPNGNCNDEDVVEDPERSTVVEDSAVKEEDAEFDAAVCEFFDHQNGVVELLRGFSQSMTYHCHGGDVFNWLS